MLINPTKEEYVRLSFLEFSKLFAECDAFMEQVNQCEGATREGALDLVVDYVLSNRAALNGLSDDLKASRENPPAGGTGCSF